MKKIFSMLLVAAMLVAMLPCFAVGASAEDAATVQIGATAVDPTDLWAAHWTGNSGLTKAQMPADGTTAMLERPAVLDRFELVTGQFAGRANGSVIWGSMDGEKWDELTTITGLSNGTQYETPSFTISSTKAYLYVKITPGSSTWHSADRGFRLYGTPVEAVAIGATAVDSSDFLAPAWAGGASLCRGSLPAEGSVAVLESPAILDRLDVYTGSFAGRANGSVIWGSVDGENWDELTTMSGFSNGAQYETHSFSISSTKAYRYVKITKEGGWNAACRTLTVYGYEAVAKDVDVAFTQTKIDESAWSVRFVSMVEKTWVDEGKYAKIGYNITATGTGITDKSWTNLESNVVYTGAYETQEGSDEPVLHAAPYHAYFHMVTIANISLEDYEDVTFTITPYAVLSDGETYIYGTPKTIAFVDGVRADA